MLTTVFESFGYCRIGSTIAARKPISRISRLTTIDSTGRLIKISVKAIAAPLQFFPERSAGTADSHFRGTQPYFESDHAPMFSNAADSPGSAAADRSISQP